MSNSKPLIPGYLLKAAIGLAALTQTYVWHETEFFFIPMICAMIAASGLVALGRIALARLIDAAKQKRALVPSAAKGTARWASWKDLKSAYSGGAPFWGLLDGKPVRIDYEAAALTVAPAGAGKTSRIVIPHLATIKTSIVVPDLKGELLAVAAPLRRRLCQKVYSLNPSRLFVEQAGEPSRYNPLVILDDDWRFSRVDMIADARAIALQLCPEPAKASENKFFRSGSRKIIAFGCLVEVIDKGADATLSGVCQLIADPSRFREAVYAASVSDALDGEIAAMAADFIQKLEGGSDPRQWGSFLEGALQALEVFSPSGRIAESVSACDFRFTDLKDEKASVFIVSDPTRLDVYAPWTGLMMWCAITELVRCRSHKTVTLLCDEATNFYIDNLPGLLTRLRGFGVRIHVIIQELEDFARIYGREGLEILLSQTEIQQYFSSRSQRTLSLLSERLGKATQKTSSYDLGHGASAGARRSVGEDGVPLLTPDEVRQLDGALLFAGSNPPAVLETVPYWESWPMAWFAGVNPYHGRKRIGRPRVWL
jgi:type IV secretion system protein VirD4